MKPQTALKFKYSVLQTYTREQIDAARDEWLAEYDRIAADVPSVAALCECLKGRITRATELLADRVLPPKNKSFALSHDDAYYEWLAEVEEEENATLDGGFFTGNEEDMSFASYFMTVRELALLQAGLAEHISCGKFTGYNTDVCVREGIVAEAQGKWQEAAVAYGRVSTSLLVEKREHACRAKAAAVKENENG